MPRDDRVGYRHFLRSRAVFVERPEGLAGRRRCNNTVIVHLIKAFRNL
jgi:hypothetical protein